MSTPAEMVNEPAADLEEFDEDRTRMRTEIAGICVAAATLLLTLALTSYRPVGASASEATNWIGPVGAVTADTLYFTFGLVSYLLVLAGFAGTVAIFMRRRIFDSLAAMMGWGLATFSALALTHLAMPRTQFFGHDSAGVMGRLFGDLLAGLFGELGALVIGGTMLTVAVILILEMSLMNAARAVASGVSNLTLRRAVEDEGWTFEEEEYADDTFEDESFEDEEEDEDEDELPTFRLSPSLDLSDSDADDSDIDESELDDEDEDTDKPGLFRRLSSAFSFGKNRWEGAVEDLELDDLGDLEASLDAAELSDEWSMGSGVREAKLDTAAEPIADDADEADDLETSLQDIDASWDDVEAEISQEVETIDEEDEVVETVNARTSGGSASTDNEPNFGPMIVESDAVRNRKRAEDLERIQAERAKHQPSDDWQLPPLSFLDYDESSDNVIDKEYLLSQAARLEKALADFKVNGKVSNICPGPVITTFEFEPEAGTKVRKISSLTDDIAMALRAKSIRIIAPIPGKGCVGIEVPNEKREIVYLKEILADDKFAETDNKLTVGLGKDVEGYPVVANLAKMPHLLVAGTTGSGKSVSVNGMITSILYNASPDDVRMILIDPKQLEFALYEGIPHLLLPVVTDPAKAATALNWAVVEMERRYKLMKEMKVRNIKSYNKKLKGLEDKYDPTSGVISLDPMERLLDEVDESGKPKHRHMPYIVVIIDEFADLMMVSGKEVEVAVARLAQKARAAGIHVILATQRPSVDVLTGLIKANFPTRMSFRLISGTDSRTVLDTTGAENLLGMGDMLYRPPGRSELKRVHGAFIDEHEIEQIVDFLKEQRQAEYDESILIPPDAGDVDDDEPVDELYDQAVSVVIEAGYASISMVQRKLRVGYNRSARMIDHMEREGVIGPSTGGSSRREVLVGGAHIGA